MNFVTLAFNPTSRMNEIERYSSVYQETKENLSEHISEVSMMSYLIVKYISSQCGEEFDIGVLLEKCLLHDIDEVITGDIPRNTKYATNEAHNQLNKVAEDTVSMIENMIGIDIKRTWTDSKHGKEGIILKVVDMLVVAKKAITEIELRGNCSFLKVVTELEGHLTKMLTQMEGGAYRAHFANAFSATYLTSLVREAKDEITTIRVKYNHLIDKYMIRENVIKGE